MTNGRIGVALAFVLLTAAHAWAQEAGVSGTVLDESKGVLPGVTVTATDPTTGRTFTSVTDGRGEYRIPKVPPGKYNVRAELSGFATSVVNDLELLVGQNATVTFTMKVARLSENLTVTGESPLVDTRSTQVAGNIDRRQMEELPIQGRNWMELSMMVKGVTSNDISNSRPGVGRDDQFQLNLDGQQITQQVAWANLFGQPRLSRESIAEYQVVTNMFDITMGRSVGLQVQAISRSGTNIPSGSVYGYFRDSKFNAKDFVVKQVVPYANQQIGGAIGGPLIKDKMHFFANYERENEPNTIISKPPALGGQTGTFATKTVQPSFLGRIDYQANARDHLVFRATYWSFNNPFDEVLGTDYPTSAARRERDSNILTGNWSRVVNSNTTLEVKGGFYHYHWTHVLADGVPSLPTYSFPSFSVISHSNYPEEFWQNMPSARADVNWHKEKHDLKVGGEFLLRDDTGWWRNNERGVFTFTQLPADIARRFPIDAWNDPSRWDVSGLDSIVLNFRRNYAIEGGQNHGNGNYSLFIPRKTWALWLGDTWSASSKLTLNLGIRWDVDWGATSPPAVQETSVAMNNGFDPANFNVGYRNGIRDLRNIGPRAGATYKLNENGDFLIRGGGGLFYSTQSSNLTFSQQLFNGQRIIVNAFPNDGLPGFLQDPTRGKTADDFLSGRVALAPQNPSVIAHDYRNPRTFQATGGVQKGLGQIIGVDADLTYYKGTNMGINRDINLFYDPVTGYPKNPATAGRPRPDFGPITWYQSTATSDYFALANSFTRRYRDNWQAGLTYTLVFFQHDDGTGQSGYSGTLNNQFCIACERATSTDFQRHTLRANSIYKAPFGITIAASYFFGSGNRFATTFPGLPFGAGTNRFVTAPSVTIPAEVADRFLGPTTFTAGQIVPRNALKGTTLSKFDVRFTKELAIPGSRVRLTGIAEVFNVFNHANYGLFNGVVGTATFGQPVQVLSTSFLPRVLQLAFKVAF